MKDPRRTVKKTITPLFWGIFTFFVVKILACRNVCSIRWCQSKQKRYSRQSFHSCCPWREVTDLRLHLECIYICHCVVLFSYFILRLKLFYDTYGRSEDHSSILWTERCSGKTLGRLDCKWCAWGWFDLSEPQQFRKSGVELVFKSGEIIRAS